MSCMCYNTLFLSLSCPYTSCDCTYTLHTTEWLTHVFFKNDELEFLSGYFEEKGKKGKATELLLPHAYSQTCGTTCGMAKTYGELQLTQQ